MKNEASCLDLTIHRDSLHQHLHTYALAASAAGVTMLALAHPAPAEIVYTPANVTIGPNQSYDLDLNNDGIVDFSIIYQSQSTSATELNLFVQNPGGGNAVAGHLANTGGFLWAYAFYSGFKVTKAQRHFTSGRATMAWARPRGQYWTVWGGSWAGSSFGIGVFDRYLGLKFAINGKIHYGWARLSTDFFYEKSVTLTGYAYENTPNKAIKTGQEKGTDDGLQPDPAVLTRPAQRQGQGQRPATLGMLARGSRALATWRQKEEVVQQQDAP